MIALTEYVTLGQSFTTIPGTDIKYLILLEQSKLLLDVLKCYKTNSASDNNE